MIQFDEDLKATSATIYRAFRAIDLLDAEKKLAYGEKRSGLVFIEITLTEALKQVNSMVMKLDDEALKGVRE